jgi:asparagine N-glycosylation enzyme membrane subunit Stt3
MKLSVVMVLAGLILGALHLKVRLSTDHPRFDPRDETGYYRAESALQYRYAGIVAEGRRIPKVDREAQFPEGIRTDRELTSLMERLVGVTYKLFGGAAAFRWFCVLWVALVSSLSIIPLYYCALRLTRSESVSLAAAAAYGLSWAAQANVIAAFRLETLGLPLIFASLACCAAVLDADQ